MKNYFILFFFFLSVFLLTAGGRVASSDETAFFLEAQSLVENGTLAIPEGIVDNGARGPDGRFYVGGGIGFTAVALPFYLAGKAALALIPVPDPYRLLVLKGFFSLTNQFLCAVIGILFFVFCRKLNYSGALSFFLTCGLLFTTNLFPYAKSSMREPLITLCILAMGYGLWSFSIARHGKFLHMAGAALFLLLITKWSFVVLLPCVALYVTLIFNDRPFVSLKSLFNDLKYVYAQRAFIKCAAILGTWLLAALLTVGVYDFILFGNVLSSGYTERPQPFTNPLWVGIYGLLFSSGKSFFLYAPLTVLIFRSGRTFYRQFRNESLLFLSMFVVLLIFHAKYFAWAGDGSWGPRYLIPMLPYFVLPVGCLYQKTLEQTKKFYKLAAILLAALGFIIQLGGCSIYLGSYLRFIGEYPFKTTYSDPDFMYRSHFVPNYSPVVGHWELLVRALEKHAAGEIGRLTIADTQQRIPITEGEYSKLVYVIDYWFMYASYAGVPTVWLVLLVGGNGAIVMVFGRKSYRAFCLNGN